MHALLVNPGVWRHFCTVGVRTVLLCWVHVMGDEELQSRFLPTFKIHCLSSGFLFSFNFFMFSPAYYPYFVILLKKKKSVLIYTVWLFSHMGCTLSLCCNLNCFFFYYCVSWQMVTLLTLKQGTGWYQIWEYALFSQTSLTNMTFRNLKTPKLNGVGWYVHPCHDDRTKVLYGSSVPWRQ